MCESTLYFLPVNIIPRKSRSGGITCPSAASTTAGGVPHSLELVLYVPMYGSHFPSAIESGIRVVLVEWLGV